MATAAIDASKMRSIAEGGAQRVDAFRSQIESESLDTVTEAARLLASEPGMEAQLQSLHGAVEQMLQMDAELGAHSSALRHLAANYTPPYVADPSQPSTDFTAHLASLRREHLTTTGFDPNTDERMRRYEREVRAVEDPGGAGELEDPDAEFVMGDSDQPCINTKCPLSTKHYLELSEPVEDDHGYVYEKEVVVRWIQQQTRQLRTAPHAPTVGTNYILTVAQLKPARKVLRAQKRAKAKPTQATETDCTVEVE